MVEKDRSLTEVPQGRPWSLPEKDGANVLHDAGLDFVSSNLLEEAGVDVDFDAFRREASADEESLIYTPKLSELETRTLAMAEANIRDAVVDIAITDEAIVRAGRKKITDLLADNIGNPLIQQLLNRFFALDQRKKLQACPTATVTAALLLMDDDALRMIGADIAFAVPDGITTAFKQLHKARMELPGGKVFVQMQQRGEINDKESFFAAARKRSVQFFETLISTVDAIDEQSLLQFAEMTPKGAERFKQRVAELNLLTPLKDRESSLREAIITYAKHVENGRSHFGNVVEKDDGTYEAIGLKELRAAHDASGRFFSNDFLRSFFINLGRTYYLPGISQRTAFEMSLQKARQGKNMTPEDMNIRADFQASIAYEIFIILRKVERLYASKLISLRQGTNDRNAVITKRAIARGVIVEMLMINESFMQTLERNTPVLQGLIRGLQADPETVIAHLKNIVRLETVELFYLGNASRLYHTHKTTLALLEGVFC